jgi:hypothetical protein
LGSIFKILGLVIGICVAVVFITAAQNTFIGNSNWRIQKYAVTDTIHVDSMSIDASNFSIVQIDSSNYTLYPFASVLVWKKKPSQDSVQINYRILQTQLGKKYNHKKVSNMSMYLGRGNNPYYEMNANTSNSIVDFGNMDYAGSLSRGINFGNSQDVVVNSQFNLQLNGMLGDSIEMQASITDNNIPFQPEGNTQNIQEFDRFYFLFKKRNARLLIGDHDLLRPKSYFMNFYKRVQGFYFTNQNNFNGKNKTQYNYGVGASLAKGKFVRTQIATKEGNQGPYKIIGPNGETFFIILANSEKIYIDGILLQRGEDKDYIIDYNQAEIIFMPRKMITKDTRLIVEYEINDRNYLNSLLYTTHELQIGKKLNLHVNAYSNQDAKKQTIQQTLDDNQEYLLSTIGDDISKAIYPSYRQDTFSANRVMYKMIDTTVNSILYDSVFVFSTNTDSAKYTMGFSFVGAGKGNYTTSANLKNGRVYSWVAPINGKPQGDYIPYIVLVTPKRQQLFTVGGTYKISEQSEVNYELGVSNNDANLFSTIDNDKHIGLAQKIDITDKRKLSSNSKWKMNNTLHYENVNSKFKQLERFREAEFTRNWTIDFNPTPQNEQLADAKIEVYNNSTTRAMYNFSTFIRGNAYKGFRNAFAHSCQAKTWRTNVNGSITTSEWSGMKSNYTRPSIEAEKTFNKLQGLTIAAKCSLENNTIKNITNDSLAKNSFGFQVAQLGIHNATDATNQWSALYFTRRDALADTNKLKFVNQSHNLNISTAIHSFKHQTINLTSTYRKLMVLDTTLYKQQAEDNLLGRLDYTISVLKNGLNYNLLYEFGSGQELKREFTYLEVPIGQGTHYWIDYNNNTVQELNEFEIAQFPDQKKYIRVFTPTNQYVSAKYNSLNQTVIANLKQIIGGAANKGLKGFAARFVLQSSIQLTNKYLSEAGLAQYNPLYKSSNVDNLINNGTSISNTIFFNRFSSIWGIDYLQTSNNTRSLLTYGIDDRGNQEQAVKIRINGTKQYTFSSNFKYGNKYFNSAFLNNRSYHYLYQSIEPNISFITQNNNTRYVVNYKYETRNNKASLGGEKALINSIGIEYKNALASKGNLNIKGVFSNISFDGEANSSVGFIMLDGLQNGKNFLWQANYEKRLAKGIELSFSYEGRKAGTQQVVHTGRASVRAIF